MYPNLEMTTNISDTIANVEELNNLYTKSSGAVREIKYQTVEPKDVILRLQQSLVCITLLFSFISPANNGSLYCFAIILHIFIPTTS